MVILKLKTARPVYRPSLMKAKIEDNKMCRVAKIYTTPD